MEIHDTSITPPKHLRDTSETPPKHLRDTSETPPRHLQDTCKYVVWLNITSYDNQLPLGLGKKFQKRLPRLPGGSGKPGKDFYNFFFVKLMVSAAQTKE